MKTTNMTATMAKKTYIRPVVDCTPMQLESRLCGESFTQSLGIGDPTNPSSGR